MKKYILIPDSFKGTMTSAEICDIMENSIKAHQPQAEIHKIPVADGGEGTVDCFHKAAGGKRYNLEVTGPFSGETTNAEYVVLPSGAAVLETASVVGLPMVEGRENPGLATTFGLGQLAKHVVSEGTRSLIIGLGGSASNDGGCGFAAGLGVGFYNSQGKRFVPTGTTLCEIEHIDLGEVPALLEGTEITAMCDIDNPMFGPKGAARVFAPQKGADTDMVALLDENLKHLAAVIKRELAVEVADVPGSGAAGALGAGMLAFCGARLKMGIDVVLDQTGFDNLVPGSFAVFTGEGRIDGQSLSGKVVIGISRRAQKYNVPVIVFAGDIADDADAAYGEGVTAILSINRLAIPFSQAKHRAKHDLASTVDTFMRVVSLNP